MLDLADPLALDAAQAAVDARRSRRVREARDIIRKGQAMLRNADIDYAAELAPILAARRPLVEADRVAAASDGGWLTVGEIAQRRPRGASKDRNAVRQALRRAAKRRPVETRKRAETGEVTFPTDWLKAEGYA